MGEGRAGGERREDKGRNWVDEREEPTEKEGDQGDGSGVGRGDC